MSVPCFLCGVARSCDHRSVEVIARTEEYERPPHHKGKRIGGGGKYRQFPAGAGKNFTRGKS